MRTIGESRELATAKIVLVEVMRIAKLSNPTSVMSINEDDIDYLARNIARDYLSEDFVIGKKLLDEAVTQFHSLCQRESKTNIGDFNRLCYAIAKQNAEDAKTMELIAQAKAVPKSIAKENIDQIKKQLTNAIKPLPYNKNYREPPECKYRISKSGKKETEMNIHELREHLSEKRMELHNDLVSYGTLKHHSDVENPELRALYLKAWSHEGITRDEKDRMKVLARLSGETIAGV